MNFREFLKSGHPGTLFTSLLYFDFCFAVWVLNGAMAPFISQEFGLTDVEKGLMVSVPVIAGALMRFPLGLLSQYIGRKRAAQLEMGLIVIGLLAGYAIVSTYEGVIAMGVILGIAGASFGVALSLGSGWYPPEHKGLAMGIAGAGNSGAVLAVLFAPPLANAYGWQAVYGLAAIPMVAAMILLQIFAKEPPDREQKKLGDYLRVLVDRDAWIFNLLYMLTFGGYIGLTSFLPTLFHDQYGIAKENIGRYAAGIIIMASVLRIIGGWMADRFGGLRVLFTLCAVIVVTVCAAATIPANPWLMVAIMVICFSAMGAGNGAVFQLVPLRFKSMTPVAGSLVGEVGALGGGFLPVAMGISMQSTGSYGPGFLSGAALAVVVLAALSYVTRQWTTTWVGAGGRALTAERSSAAAAPAAEGDFLPAALEGTAVVAVAGK
jgi:NNP family nitrate/nitrite transporter-like MFS transporter